MPFLDSDTCAEGWGGGYLFLPGFSSMNDAIHGWMTGRIDGWVSWWKKLHVKRPRRPLLYVMGEMISTWQNKQNKKKNLPPSLINKYIIIPYLDYSLDLLISFIYLLFLFYFLFCCYCWVRLFAIFWREKYDFWQKKNLKKKFLRRIIHQILRKSQKEIVKFLQQVPAINYPRIYNKIL
jgi:hypothetical protein